MRDISNVKQEIINFRKTIRPQRTVLRDLERTKQRYMREELEVYFDDIVDASERIWDMLENYKEVVEALEDTNESVISHRVNDILRVLTVDQRDRAAADVHREPVGHERRRSRRGRPDRFLDHHRRDGRAAGRDGRRSSAGAGGCSCRAMSKTRRQAVIEAPVAVACGSWSGDPQPPSGVVPEGRSR